MRKGDRIHGIVFGFAIVLFIPKGDGESDQVGRQNEDAVEQHDSVRVPQVSVDIEGPEASDERVGADRTGVRGV